MVARIFLADESLGAWQVADGPEAPARALESPLPGDRRPLPTRAVAIVPASRMRTLPVAVPPVAADKLESVVRFALEDQLAGDIERQHIVVAERRASDVLVHVIDRGWLIDALDRLARHGVDISRTVAESDLVPRRQDALATWIHRGDGGFLVERDGKVTTLDVADDALPSGLLVAIDREAGSTGGTPLVVVHAAGALQPRIDAWSRATGVTFERLPEWSWLDAADGKLQQTVDLLTPALRRTGISRAPRARNPWRPALSWLVAAFVLETTASTIAWANLHWRVASLERETNNAIRAAAPDLPGDARAGWQKYYANYRHRAGKTAPADALPMLADAGSALQAIPEGAVRAISFDGGQLTIDVERTALPAVAAAAPRWAEAGLSVLQAETPSGLRIRLTRE